MRETSSKRGKQSPLNIRPIQEPFSWCNDSAEHVCPRVGYHSHSWTRTSSCTTPALRSLSGTGEWGDRSSHRGCAATVSWYVHGACKPESVCFICFLIVGFRPGYESELFLLKSGNQNQSFHISKHLPTPHSGCS